MLVEMTQAEIIAEWRLRMGLTVSEPDGPALARSDAIPVDEMILREINDWYYDLLDNGPIQWVPVTDIHSSVLYSFTASGRVEMLLPEECRRVVSVKMTGWSGPATIVTDLNSRTAQLQRSEFTAGGAHNPVALLDGRHLYLYSLVGLSCHLERLECVMTPPKGTYIFDPAALGARKWIIDNEER